MAAVSRLTLVDFLEDELDVRLVWLSIFLYEDCRRHRDVGIPNLVSEDFLN